MHAVRVVYEYVCMLFAFMYLALWMKFIVGMLHVNTEIACDPAVLVACML